MLHAADPESRLPPPLSTATQGLELPVSSMATVQGQLRVLLKGEDDEAASQGWSF